MGKRFYITTAIDYVNSLPHIGTAYEKIGADCLARFKRMDGYEVHFLMGNDEHSVNVKKAAAAQGLDPHVYCDRMAEQFQRIWKNLHISYDDFIRTTEQRHGAAVQKLFLKIYQKGDIYRDSYEGWYCESCEAFLQEKDLVDGKCPNHSKEPKWIEEENYFFALSKYGERLLEHIESNHHFITPEIRRNEIVNLIKGGLEDISISRSSFDWGIPLPIDQSHVVYVWFDALINYISAVGYGSDEALFSQHWPADVHVIGKDITRFHCIVWPAMLMAAEVPLPKTVFGHGFVYFKGAKMSKSLGHVVEPLDVVDAYGADPLRYYLLREGSFGRDGDFTWENFIDRYNNDLANDLGNLLNRTLNMIVQYQGGTVLAPSEGGAMDEKLKAACIEALPKIRGHFSETGDDIEFHSALNHIWDIIRRTNRYVDGTAPWALYKEKRTERLATVLYNTVESLRITALLIAPFMPTTASGLWTQLGLEESMPFKSRTFKEIEPWGRFPAGTKVKLADPLFPKIERTEKEEKEMEKPEKPLIDFGEFQKMDLRTADILSAERVEGANKLLKMEIDVGGERRQIVAGIAEQYSPEELIGKKIIVVANLKPAKIRGVESQGMLLAAEEGDTLSLVTLDREIASGTKVR
ncbi:MAG: methionine--tRNA ligase [bacterium]